MGRWRLFIKVVLVVGSVFCIVGFFSFVFSIDVFKRSFIFYMYFWVWGFGF